MKTKVCQTFLVIVGFNLFNCVMCITNLPTQTVCESYTMSLVCPFGERIQILSANYGRTSSGTCPHDNDVHRNCYARGSLERVQERCGGRQRCEVQASNVVFGDPCPGTAKYLFVQYRCFSPDNYNMTV